MYYIDFTLNINSTGSNRNIEKHRNTCLLNRCKVERAHVVDRYCCFVWHSEFGLKWSAWKDNKKLFSTFLSVSQFDIQPKTLNPLSLIHYLCCYYSQPLGSICDMKMKMEMTALTCHFHVACLCSTNTNLFIDLPLCDLCVCMFK